MLTEDKHINPKMSDLAKPYNVAYLNFSMLDELDYVIGGYGKPKPEFVFTLNSFIESFVLNNIFHFSVLEWFHFTNTNKHTFKNGRPIYNILFNKGDRIVFRDWIGPFEGYCLYSEPKLEGKVENQEHIDTFQMNASPEIKNKYFKPAIFLEPDEKFAYLYRNFGFNTPPKQPNYLIFAIERSQKEILEGLYNHDDSLNIHATLPFSGIKAQLGFNESLLPSNQSIKTLSEIHNKKLEDLRRVTGYQKIPIPPLVSILLSQCRSREDIPNKLIQLREDFTELRDAFTRMERNIYEANNLTEQEEAANELVDFWSAFNRKYDSKNNRLFYRVWDLAKAADVPKAAEGVLDSGEISEFTSKLNIVTGMIRVIGDTRTYFKDKKILNKWKGMTNIWDLLRNTPTLENQKKDYERIFKTRIDIRELNYLSRLL